MNTEITSEVLTRGDVPADLNTVDGIEARRDTVLVQARALLDAAGDRDLEGDQLAEYETLEAELERLTARRDRIASLARHVAADHSNPVGPATSGAPYFNRNVDPFDLDDRRLIGAEVKGRAQAALEQIRHFDDESKNRTAALLDRIDTPDGRVSRHLIVTGRPEYRSAFIKLAAGHHWALDQREQQAMLEARAASLTDAAGGYAVPFTLDPTLILTNNGSANPWRRLARVVPITGDEWRGVTTAGVTASWDGEAAEASDDAPTLAQPIIKAHKAQASVPFSIEIGGDWPALEAELRMAFADARDRLEGTAFANGTGDANNQPTGVIPAVAAVGASVVETAGIGTFTPADLFTLQQAVPPRHRSASTWVGSISIINAIRQFGDTAGAYKFTVDLTAAGIPQLMGREIAESSDMSGTVAAGNNIVIYGDFSNYVIADRVGMWVELVPHLTGANGRPTGQRALYAYWRVGAGVVNANAFRLLKVRTA